MRDTRASGSRGWREKAVCRETDPELFFPTATHGRVYEEQVAAAKSVCARCPVRAQCLADALVGLPVGIAGGLTETERRALRRRQGLARRAASRRDQAWELLAQGASTARAASRCGVSTRTVERWAAEERAAAATSAAAVDPAAGGA